MLVVVVDGVSGAKALRVWSGGMVPPVVWGGARGFEECWVGEAEGGVDHEKAAAGEGCWERERGFGGRVWEGRVVDEDAVLDVAEDQESLIISVEESCPPRTSASKLVSSPLVASVPFAPSTAPKLMKSFEPAVVAVLLEESSCSLRVCSCSMREERVLMRAMYAWNWDRLSRGPRLNCQRMGRTSMAR